MAAGPTQMTKEQVTSWTARTGLARALKVVFLAAPIVVSGLVAWFIGSAWPPHVFNVHVVLWFAAVAFIATSFLVVTERLLRRLAPMPVLLSLSLAFPDEAPSRYRMALRTGSSKRMANRIEEVRSSGLALTTEQSYAEQMLELLAMLSAHDRLTRGHCERVRAYTDLVIEEMGITGESADRLRWAALLHDLGKLMVPEEILTKNGRPDEHEWEILKSHTWQGEKLAAPLAEWLGEWIRTIGEHHERWDGGGYPGGLQTTEIHLGARIVAVADAFDVMTSARSYKKPLPAELAREEIARCSGGQFDPDVARAFLAIGVSRLRFVAGPLSWMTSLLGLPSVTTATAPIAAAASSIGLAVAGTAVAFVPGGIGNPSPEPPAEIAFVDSATTTTAPTSATTSPGVSTTTIVTVSDPVQVVVEEGEVLLAVDDTVVLVEGATASFDALLNDEAPAGTTVQIVSYSDPSHGVLKLTADGFVYEHDGSETETDSFEYTIEADGVTVTAVVQLTIEPVNDPPDLSDLTVAIDDDLAVGDVIVDLGAVDAEGDSITFAESNPYVRIIDNLLIVAATLPDGPTTLVIEVVATDEFGASTTVQITLRLREGTVATTSSTAPTTTIATTTTRAATTTTAAATTTTAAPTTTTAAATTTTAAATTTTAPPPGGAGLLVSEFSTINANPNGDFIELFNASGSAINMSTIEVRVYDQSGVDFVIPLGSGTLQAGSFYLLAQQGSPVAGSADVTYSATLPEAIGIGVHDGSSFVDIVGTRARTENKPWVVPASAIAEGQGVPPFDAASTSNPQSFARKYFIGGGPCQDTGNNSNDFVRRFHAAGVTPTASSAGTFGCGGQGSPGTPPNHIVISEIRTDGPGGGDNEFIELFNPTASVKSLAGMRLVRDDQNQVQYTFGSESLAPGQRILLAHPNFTGPTPDRLYTGDGVKNNGGVTLEVTATSAVVDRMAFGLNAPALPPLGGRLQHSYTRRFGGCIDTGDYYVDFDHALIETPQGLGASPSPC